MSPRPYQVVAAGIVLRSLLHARLLSQVGGHFQSLGAPHSEHFCVAGGAISDSQTITPTVSQPPSPVPSSLPTAEPAPVPTPLPVPMPTAVPTLSPSPAPIPSPTPVPTSVPTAALPSALPTALPSWLPTSLPSSLPTALPTSLPTSLPSSLPIVLPTAVPSRVPTPLQTLLSCTNDVVDAAETDVDCGGGDCPRCSVGLACTESDDCSSYTCVNDVCVESPTSEPTPTPSPTRTPVVVMSLGIAGITCDDFIVKNATVYYLAVNLIVKNATFSDATCADVSSDSVLVTNELTMPLVIAATFGISVHEVSAPKRVLRVTT